MITIKAFNVIHQGRRNQNTTFFFSERDYSFNKNEITESFLLHNFDLIRPPDVYKQTNTTLKILKS